MYTEPLNSERLLQILTMVLTFCFYKLLNVNALSFYFSHLEAYVLGACMRVLGACMRVHQ